MKSTETGLDTDATERIMAERRNEAVPVAAEELAALRLNDARYRWLRDASIANGAIGAWDLDFWDDLGDLLGEDFDAAIDAARRAKEGT